jgi:hypothetical protein
MEVPDDAYHKVPVTVSYNAGRYPTVHTYLG